MLNKKALSLISVLLASMPVGAQNQTAHIENLATAKRFLAVAYPRLAAGFVVQVVHSSRLAAPLQFDRFRMYVNETGNDIDPSQYADVLLGTDFVFDNTGRIENFFGYGRLTRDVENKNFAQDVQRHPEWPEARIGEELRQRGAQFGSDRGEALLSTLTIRSLEPMLGELTLLESVFRIPPADERKRNERFGEGDINWRLEFQSGTGLHVFIDAEPFGGTITSVQTMRPR